MTGLICESDGPISAGGGPIGAGDGLISVGGGPIGTGGDQDHGEYAGHIY